MEIEIDPANTLDSAKYSQTNESIWAIVAGLDIQPGDKVLAVCGSGNQAFAMLGNGAEVDAFDIDPAQIRLATSTQKYAIKDSFEAFIWPFYGSTHPVENPTFNAKYVYFKNIFGEIKSNINNLHIYEGDILDVNVDQAGYNKIYLSNIFFQQQANTPLTAKIIQFFEAIPPGTLLYYHLSIIEQAPSFMWKYFDIDIERTTIAMDECEEKTPWCTARVYRRRAT